MTPQSGTFHSYSGVIYTLANGGTLYLADSGQNSIDWLSNVDALRSGNYAPTGNLFGLSSVGNLALDGSQLLLATGPSTSATIQSWNLSSVSGSANKTVSSPHGDITGMVYVP